MRKKIQNSSPKLNDIELPLLSETREPISAENRKSRFMEFFDPSCPSSKFIQKMNPFKFFALLDMWPFLKLSNKKTTLLDINDLPFPFAFCSIEQKIIAIDKEWTASVNRGDPSFVKAIAKAYKKEILISMLLSFVLVNTKLANPLLLGQIIKNISNSNFGEPMDFQYTLFLACLVTITSICTVFATNWYWHYAVIISANLRNAIIGYTYRKLQCVALSSIQELNIGKVINLLSNDVNEIDKELIYIIPLLLSPYTLLLGGMLVYNFFGFATIFGFLGLVGALGISNYLSKISVPIKADKKGITDERIKLTNELIECIRLIKMYAWEKPFRQAIEALRNNEGVKLIKLKFVEAVGRSISDASSQASLLIICLVYIAGGGVLSPQGIYTGLMILNFLGLWGILFPHEGLMFIANVRVIKTRIENLLLIKEIPYFEESVKNMSSENLQSEPLVSFQSFSAWWKKEDPKPCLNNINLVIYPNQLTTVIGTIGSGKTSFLLSLLREIPLTQGTLSIKGTVAYVEQEPMIFSGTVRSNILFGLEYDDVLYKKVIRACNLHADLKQFEDSDMTIVGERGITLSGGQKARLSLARALYSQSDIYLLDDPLSAVDSKVGRHLFRYAIKGDLMRNKTVVLVTHHLNYAKESDRVLFFSEGQIVGDGTFEAIRMIEDNLFNKFKEIEDEVEKRKESLRSSTMSRGVSEIEKIQPIDQKQSSEQEGEGEQAEVTWKTYLNYMKENGSLISFIAMIMSYVVGGCVNLGFSRFVGYWGQAHATFYYEKEQNPAMYENQSFDNTWYIVIATSIILTFLFALWLQTVLTGKYLVQAHSNMHNKILNKLIQAQVLFFDKTPIGVVLNRFSTDFGLLDTSNSMVFIGVLDGMVYIVFRAVVIILVNFYLIIPLVIVIVCLSKAKNFFKKAVVEVKRIDLVSRSPLYSEISATINGLLAIRTFRQGGTFIKRFCGLLYNNIRASIYSDRTIRFFSFVLTAVFESLLVMGTFASVILAHYAYFEAGLFGLTLLILQEIGTIGSWFIRTSLTLDINMQSTERIFQFYEIEQEAPQYIKERDKKIACSNDKKWPFAGEIVFDNVFMKYRPEFDYVLKGLSFKIKGGEKIGIVGRTGAGKSSIIQALFRMTEIDSIPGSSIVIDGVDISKIGLNLLRNSISIIPQTPVVFTGTIRRNLDPFNMFTDKDLWKVLEEVNLKEHVAGLEKQLDTDMTMSSSVFSAGQKQLICLARAILKESKIIVLDEATANVDIETDDFIQRKIMEKFRDSTVITIAHRLITIANYDKVIVMDKGRVVEHNSPYELMVNVKGDQSITRNDGLFAQMVLNSGDNMAKKIFKIAHNKSYDQPKEFSPDRYQISQSFKA